MKTIQLEELGLTPLSQSSLEEISGGFNETAYKIGQAVGHALKGAAIIIGIIAIF